MQYQRSLYSLHLHFFHSSVWLPVPLASYERDSARILLDLKRYKRAHKTPKFWNYYADVNRLLEFRKIHPHLTRRSFKCQLRFEDEESDSDSGFYSI